METHGTLSRRDSLKLLFGGGIGALAMGAPPVVEKVSAAEARTSPYPGSQVVKTICNNCSVGCGILAEVDKGVWVRQEPALDHPISQGGHCCKGASAIDTVKSERRLRYPVKRQGGKWKRISWDQAMGDVSKKLLAIRKEFGPDAVMWMGSAKVSTEMAYLQRKLAAFWGTNNVDHQARICHSTTVAGVANTWGYGAMTNSMNDIRHTRLIFFIGSNAAEAHPVSMQHVLHAKESGAKLICVDPRFTRTAAKSDEYVRIRSGTDVAFIMGLINVLFAKGWEDKEFIAERTYGLDEVRKVAAQYPPEVVADVTGVQPEQLERVARMLATHKPGTVIWCMGGTQHSIGSSNTRVYCILQLVLGNMGKSGGGTNIFRGHDNVQGASDMGVVADSLPGYYGVAEGAWKHWCRVWDVDFEWMKGRFDTPEMMNKPGFTVARWYDGVLETEVDQRTNLKAVVVWGHSGNSLSTFHRVKEALDKIDLVVVIDPFATAIAAHVDRKDGIYLLPAASQFETSGSITATNRSVQWRYQVVEPVYESRPDYEICMEFARRFGFHELFAKNLKQLPEDITREINRGVLTVGYTGHTPERLKRHTEMWGTFQVEDLKAGPTSPCAGEYYGLPWPCWTPEHPGTPILYDISKPVAEGGLPFRNRFGLKAPEKWPQDSQLASDGSANPGSKVSGGYAEFTEKSFAELGIELTAEEQELIKGRDWKTDLSGTIVRKAIANGMAPFGNARARAIVWEWPDPIPIHREPLHTPRPDLISRYPTYDDKPKHFRLTTRFKSEQKPEWAAEYPIVITTGRMVEYMGGGARTSANKYLAELQPQMYAEINVLTAEEYGLGSGDYVWIESPNGGQCRVKVKITDRVNKGLIFLPYHFCGEEGGQSRAGSYPEGCVPYVMGAPANLVTNYGYDIITQMQETKTGLCRIRKA
ncbi:MAG: molybdopterin-dependent oxidoreductase [Candidatus Latescibacterota bacterium]